MKYKKFIIVILFIVIFVFIFQSTYAKYRDRIDGTTNIRIASWNIVVNDETLLTRNELEQNIVPVLPGSEYIAPNVLAPGAVGYYDIIINSTDVDVSFNYNITPLVSQDSIVSDLIVTGYEVNPTIENNIIPFEDVIEGIINYNENSTTIRIHIKWEDDTDTTMDNEADTNASLTNGQALINNSIIFSQIK